jgi:hypothetical protein
VGRRCEEGPFRATIHTSMREMRRTTSPSNRSIQPGNLHQKQEDSVFKKICPIVLQQFSHIPPSIRAACCG